MKPLLRSRTHRKSNPEGFADVGGGPGRVRRTVLPVILAALFGLGACGDPADPVPTDRMDGSVVLRNGVLTVSGDASPNDIRVAYSPQGVAVDIDGRTTEFSDSVGLIEITAGPGNDVVRFTQTALDELELSIAAGGGDDQVVLLLEPAGETDAATFAATLATGSGSDVLDLHADYSGITAQQGRVALDADLGEGDNQASTWIRTLQAPTSVDASVRAGDGNNVLDLENVLGGDGDHAFALDVGDGDNRASIRFGDGQRGARPASGQRNVTATYRSGTGRNGVDIHSDIVEPLNSSVTLDYGGGAGTTTGRYKVRFPWDTQDPPEAGAQPTRAKVVVLSPSESALDLAIDVGDPDVDDPASFGTVTVQAAAVQQTDFDFIHERATTTGVTGERAWTLGLANTRVTGDAEIVVDAPPGLERIVYLQDVLEVAAGASLGVALQGDAGSDALLAHLLGLSASGRYELVAGGGTGNDLLALLTRNLVTTGAGTMTFDVTGGDGDDVLGLDAPAGLDPAGPILHGLAAGAGTDACFGPQEVPATGCERLEPVGQELLSRIETTFGTDLVQPWRE